MAAIEIRFWGVRGSTPVSGPEYEKFGSHTSCVSMEIEAQDTVIVLDAGTGMVDLGRHLIQKGLKKICLFTSHCHLDHVSGLPFFEPLWRPDCSLTLVSDRANMKDFLEQRLFSEPLFPVTLDRTLSKKEFVLLKPAQIFERNSFKVSNMALQHPGGSVGYRFEIGGVSVCYMTDLEHNPDILDQDLVAFVQGADLMIYDSAYTEEVFAQKRGWGHSTHIRAAEVAQAAAIKQLVLFHHAPENTDTIVAQQEAEAQKIFPRTIASFQGCCIRL